MQIQNQIISYFVDLSSYPKVFKSPVTMNSDVAYEIIKSECKYKPSNHKLIHICYDIDSTIIYIPNGSSFTSEQKKSALQAVKYYIIKEFGDFKSIPPIEGSPFSSLRIRSIKSFGYVFDSINEYFEGDVQNLTVVEANLARMPSTVSKLPSIYLHNKNYSGGIIWGEDVTFVDAIDIDGKTRKNPIQLITFKTPFILIDISPLVSTSLTEKEWVVLSGYRDYICSTKRTKSHIESFAPLFAAKRYMYLGWPFEEICKVLLECVKDFGSLMKGIDNLISANNNLINEGYGNMVANPYYMAFKVDIRTFPLDLEKSDFKIPFFEIIEYDEETKFIIIKTTVYIDSDLCLNVLCAKSRPYIIKYNHLINKIDVKVHDAIHKELKIRTFIPDKLRDIIKKENKIEGDLDFRSDARSRSISLSSGEMCNIRMISDYYSATDQIKLMCNRRNVTFEDIPVVVGPIEKIFGNGIQGGFMGKKQFEESKLKMPYQIEKGLYVSPPIIMVNSISMPSYAAQTEVLIHEYSHKIYSMQNPDHKHLYNKDYKLRNKNTGKYWELYLGDEDERIAHKEEIRFELISGKSIDEIVRDKVGGAITKNNYKNSYDIAINFKSMVDEVVREIEEKNEHTINGDK
jgi:hypothetical protein